MTSHRAATHRLALAGVVLALCVTVTACAERPTGFPFAKGGQGVAKGEQGGAGPPGRRQGVVSLAEAKRVWARHNRLEERAAKRNVSSAASTETGLALEISQAQTRIRKLRGERRKPVEPLAKVTYAIPAKTANRPWFLVEYNRQGWAAGSWVQLIFVKTEDAGWRMAAGTYVAGGVKRPAIAVDRDGLATAVPPDTRGGSAFSPRQVAQAMARSWQTRHQDEQALRVLAPGPFTSEQGKAQRAEEAPLKGQWDVRSAHQAPPEVYALKTRDGGTAVWHAVRGRIEFTARSAARSGGRTLAFPGDTKDFATLSRGRSYASRATLTEAAWFAADVPAKGKARVYAEWYAGLAISGR
ncbi:hypothetical protein HII36_48195 [Nonomuraea sp. NN258]|uniref:hypothetical protein n=1 Tax=Nonomuraea antri TaxID=2730852 RepID=UPI00156A2F49|nr:hypothetical protein [Nonomuraea antri]NRQ39561.1 hypothetical protein [Nonomuraea antri]